MATTTFGRGRYDVAGNMGATERELSGREAIRAVPARIGTRIVAGQVKRVTAGGSAADRAGRGRSSSCAPVCHTGGPSRSTGGSTTPGGNPVANANIEVWEQLALPGARSRRVAIVATSGAGRFKFKALRGPSRHLALPLPRHSGCPRANRGGRPSRQGEGHAPRPRRSESSMARRSRFAGACWAGRCRAVGKLLQLQAFSRGKWLTFATPRANAVNGRWSYRYRFTSTRGTVRYRFRARIPREAGFPYDPARLVPAPSSFGACRGTFRNFGERSSYGEAMRRIRQRLSYANVAATMALFIALGGTSYAAVAPAEQCWPCTIARELRRQVGDPA